MKDRGSRTASGGENAAANPLRLASYRVTDVSAVAGSVVWVALIGAARAGWLDLTLVELFVALAVLAFVPLGLGLAANPQPSARSRLLYRLAVAGQFPSALGVAGALALPVGSPLSMVLVVPWLGVTGALAVVGLWRAVARGVGPIPDLAVDAALLYLPVGAVALLLHRAGISLQFQPIIVLLTAVHYHYAGFALPLITGLAGRVMADDDHRFGTDPAGRLAAATTLVIVVNLALIAAGITFSPLVEVVAVSFFTVAVAGFALLVAWRVVPAVSIVPGALLVVASVAVVGTMALALAYGYSAFSPTTTLITISEMVRWHGTLNAFGFVLPALLAFRLLEA